MIERRVALEGQSNFRDLGGYETIDGRRVKRGVLYRSGELGRLTDDDVRVVERLGLRFVCDLRSRGEADEHVSRVVAGAVVERLPLSDDGPDEGEIAARIAQGDSTVIRPDMLIEGNRAFVLRHAERFAQMMRWIMDPARRPALVHCTAGKDRAGFAAAVILWTLGVPDEIVREDYLASNEYRAADTERALAAVGALGHDVELMRTILEVRPEYLDAAVDAMVEGYGSIDAYLRDGLGITDAQRRQLPSRPAGVSPLRVA